jgi:hypothetical protein
MKDGVLEYEVTDKVRLFGNCWFASAFKFDAYSLTFNTKTLLSIDGYHYFRGIKNLNKFPKWVENAEKLTIIYDKIYIPF